MHTENSIYWTNNNYHWHAPSSLLFVPSKKKKTFIPHSMWPNKTAISKFRLISVHCNFIHRRRPGEMTRNLAAVATVLVLILSLVIHNSAYITLIERQLKLCRSGSHEDDSRVRRWGWWGPNSPLQVCISHSFDTNLQFLYRILLLENNLKYC